MLYVNPTLTLVSKSKPCRFFKNKSRNLFFPHGVHHTIPPTRSKLSDIPLLVGAFGAARYTNMPPTHTCLDKLQMAKFFFFFHMIPSEGQPQAMGV